MGDELAPPGALAENTRLVLDMRGACLAVDRDTLMSLPESVLLCLFPNGLLLPEPDEMGDASEDRQPIYVDYVLTFFRQAQDYFYGTEAAPGVYRGPGLHPSYLDMFDPASGAAGSYGQPFYLPLFHKQTVIVLREELEYFAMPPKEMATTAAVPQATPNMPPGASPAFTKWKDDCGTALLHRRQIFSALQRSVHKENNVAEQHLIDMLCMSGFEHEDQWGYRAREPSRCGITSTALVLLKTGVTHAGELPGETIAFPAPVGVHRAHTAPPPPPTSEELGEWMDDGQGGALRVDQAQLSTTQKLLLFWRKPARKCWWDGVDVVVPVHGAAKPVAVSTALLGTFSPQERQLLEKGAGQLARVWVRRVWTLEVSLACPDTPAHAALIAPTPPARRSCSAAPSEAAPAHGKDQIGPSRRLLQQGAPRRPSSTVPWS